MKLTYESCVTSEKKIMHIIIQGNRKRTQNVVEEIMVENSLNLT